MACKIDGASVVVWEYLDNALQWIPYDTDVCDSIEKAFNKKLSSLRLGDVDPSLIVYTINFTLMEQTRMETGRVRPIRRSLYLSDSCPGKGISWQWSDGVWCPYSVEIQDAMETHKGSKQKLDLESHSVHLPYIVDCSAMLQINKSSKNKIQIRRLHIKPYPNVGCSNDLINSSNGNKNTAFGSFFSQFIPTFLKCSSTESPALAAAGYSPNKPNDIKTTTRKPQIIKYSRKLSSTTNVVDNPPVTNSTFSHGELLQNFTKSASLKEPTNCIICCEDLNTSSGYSSDSDAVTFIKCEHSFHKDCLLEMLKSGNITSYIQCPVCKMIYGQKIGTQPPGTMSFSLYSKSLPGYDCNTITIVYDLKSGTQGPEHPNPGKRYSAVAFPRQCYLPNNKKGRKVLDLLCAAWKQRLIFTIGTSVTNGSPNVITWNEIHHKTEFGSNHSGHGYPDVNYLDNVLKELASHGVVDEDQDG